MKYVNDEYSATYEEKKSKFIAHLCAYEKFDEVMKRLKEEHPKGRHHVYAYRYLNEYSQIVENSSDDGEPKGTSGKPSLHVLAGNELINSAVIIVRYFGGIKLGTGGLVRAYGDAVNLVISKATLHEYKKLEQKSLACSYSELSKIEYMLQNASVTVLKKEFEQDVILHLEASSQEFIQLEEILPRHLKLT